MDERTRPFAITTPRRASLLYQGGQPLPDIFTLSSSRPQSSPQAEKSATNEAY